MFNKVKRTVDSLFYKDNKKIKIAPFQSYFPSIKLLTEEQYQTYIFIKSKLAKNIFVDVDDNISYIFLYVYELLENIKNIEDIPLVINELEKIKTQYKHYKTINGHITGWVADLFYVVGNYEKALYLYKSLLNIKTVNTHLANKILNLKYMLNIETEAIEWLSLEKRFTKFISDKYVDIQKYCDFVLTKEKEFLKKDYLQYIMEKYKDTPKYFNYLFSGLVCGYDLQQLNLKNDYYFIPIYSIPEVLEFCNRLSRDAENLLREKMEIPKIGEGWIRETELFYKIKNYCSNYTVIHHYREKWLGRQHLDIYIKELKIAFEYQGLQHFKPVDFFGGEKAFKKNRQRDKIKQEKCRNEKITLYHIEPGYDFEQIIYIIDKHIRDEKAEEDASI